MYKAILRKWLSLTLAIIFATSNTLCAAPIESAEVIKQNHLRPSSAVVSAGVPEIASTMESFSTDINSAKDTSIRISLEVSADAILKQRIIDRIAKIESKGLIDSIREKRPECWRPSAGEKFATIKDQLGWLDLPESMEDKIEEIEEFAQHARRKYTDVVVLGMGGASLCVTMLKDIFSDIKPEGYPALHVLDLTHPNAVKQIEEELRDRLKSTLFIVSTKSGSTLETISFYAYFAKRLAAMAADVKEHFIAITDEDSKIDLPDRFNKIFYNPKDIGGRFSVLSYFGLLPAALMGINIEEILKTARDIRDNCFSSKIKDVNLAGLFAIALYQAYIQGRDKATFIIPDELKSIGLWKEQLYAESLGKGGKGIIPVMVTSEEVKKLLKPSPVYYGNDRIFIRIRFEHSPDVKETDKKIEELKKAGFPVIEIKIADKHYTMGAMIFMSEFAIAVCGSLMDINPFNELGVKRAKQITNEILSGTIEKSKPIWQDELIEVYTPRGVENRIKKGLNTEEDLQDFSIEQIINAYFKMLKPADYIGLLPYAYQDDSFWLGLKDRLFEKLHMPIVFGYGPRFQHSIGQHFKAGKNNGQFISLTFQTPKKEDMAIPYDEQLIDILNLNEIMQQREGSPITFAELCVAQARGIAASLQESNRRTLRIHFKTDVQGAKDYLQALFSKIATTAPTPRSIKASPAKQKSRGHIGPSTMSNIELPTRYFDETAEMLLNPALDMKGLQKIADNLYQAIFGFKKVAQKEGDRDQEIAKHKLESSRNIRNIVTSVLEYNCERTKNIVERIEDATFNLVIERTTNTQLQFAMAEKAGEIEKIKQLFGCNVICTSKEKIEELKTKGYDSSNAIVVTLTDDGLSAFNSVFKRIIPIKQFKKGQYLDFTSLAMLAKGLHIIDKVDARTELGKIKNMLIKLYENLTQDAESKKKIDACIDSPAEFILNTLLAHEPDVVYEQEELRNLHKQANAVSEAA